MKTKLITGVKPTGEVHLGNYFGALKNLKNYQEEFESYVFIADYHALTSVHNKEELEKRLRFEEQRQKDRISKLTKQREMLEKEEQKIITIEKDLGSKKLKFEKENKEFFIKKALDKYKQRYPNIFYDEEEGYIKFSNNGDYLHRFIYRRKFDKNLGNKVVHHIDTDKLNNDDYNLISIPYERHKELNHTLIDFKDWESGIKQLKEQLDMEDSDFPEHIQKKIEEIRRQKRLGAYARKSRRKR